MKDEKPFMPLGAVLGCALFVVIMLLPVLALHT